MRNTFKIGDMLTPKTTGEFKDMYLKAGKIYKVTRLHRIENTVCVDGLYTDGYWQYSKYFQLDGTPFQLAMKRLADNV